MYLKLIYTYIMPIKPANKIRYKKSPYLRYCLHHSILLNGFMNETVSITTVILHTFFIYFAKTSA